MLNLPKDYLETYRDNVQAVTIEQIQRVAQAYVKPDQAAIVIVGDGASVLDQIRPYCADIETYTTAGKLKEAGAVPSADITGSWSIYVDTPLGQSIPATLSIDSTDGILSGKISSDMGNADLGAITLKDNSFQAQTSIEMDGHAVAAEIQARFEGESLTGTLKLRHSPPLSFHGEKAS